MTFEWEEITDEVLEKVVCFTFRTSSGMGGPGALIAITENGQEYFIGLPDCRRADEFEIIDRFLGERPVTSSEELERTHEIGKWRIIKFILSNYFIRKDYYDRIFPEWKKYLDEKGLISVTEMARDLLDPQGKLPKMVLAETQARLDEEERWRKEQEEWRAKNRLVEGEDYEWKKLDGVLDYIYYLLLFKEEEDGTISGSKWTIVCQREQFQEGSIMSNAPVEAYNLYYKRYENMGGILDYPEDGKTEGKEIYRYTTLDDPQYHDYGRFHRTYRTLEEAKAAALTRNEFMGWGNYYKANLLKRNWSEMTVEEAKRDYFRAVKREKELLLLFPKICSEVVRILSKYDFPGNAIGEICESLELSEADVKTIYGFFSSVSMFAEYELEKTEKLLGEMLL